MKEIFEAATKSIWKEVRELALKKGTETLVAEGIKSLLEIAKRRHIRRDEYDFAEWKKAQKPEDEKPDKEKKSAKGKDDAESSDSDNESDESPDAADPEESEPES